MRPAPCRIVVAGCRKDLTVTGTASATTRGLDPFKIAGASISGWYPSTKTPDGRQPFTSQLEFALGLYVEFHPLVVSYQRGDLSPTFARAHQVAAPLGTPYAIAYAFDGKRHEYLPDYVGTLVGGGLLIAEAGRVDDKSRARARAKLEAARHLAALKGGALWIGTDENLSRRRQHNLVFLHARRLEFPACAEITSGIAELWQSEDLPVAEIMARLGRHWSPAEVEAAAWKLVADAAARGGLAVDLASVLLTRATPIRLLGPEAPPLVPEALPDHLPLPPTPGPVAARASDEELEDAPLGEHPRRIPGPAVDSEGIEPPARRAAFLRNLAVVTDILAGAPVREAAARRGLGASTACRLVRRALERGEEALVPYRSYARPRRLRPEFQQLIRTLYTHAKRPSITAIHEHPRLKRLADELTAQEGPAVSVPSYLQVYRFVASIAHEPAVADARSGAAHPPRPRTSTASYVLSIPAPAQVCQVDEHYLDINVVALDGTPLTGRVHAAVLVCVKTAAILAGVLSLDVLREEDYLRLVRQALEPKDRLVELAGCTHAWPCHGKPAVIFHDRGKVFTAERATQVLVNRLGIVSEQAPPYAPTAKGTVEALFTWIGRKFAHRLPGTTKSDPAARGAYDSAAGARSAGITLDVLEALFYRAIVDGYLQEWDRLRGQRRIVLWEEAVAEHGVPPWLGSRDDLTLLLLKAHNARNRPTGRYRVHTGHGISFQGRWYVSPGLLDRLRGQEVDIYYDRRDIAVIYLFVDGVHVGEAYCAALAGRRVSEWEARAIERQRSAAARDANAEARRNLTAIQGDARRGRRAQYRETLRLERQRQLDRQRPEIHTEQVAAVLAALEAGQHGGEPSPALLPLPPPVLDAAERPVRRPAIRRRGADDR